MPEQSFFGFVTHVAGDGPFIQIWASKSREKSFVVEESLQHLATAFNRGVGIVNPANLKNKQLICARWEDCFWYRARIIDITNICDEIVEIQYIDCGRIDIVSIDEIRTLETVKDNPVVDFPPLAKDYLLAGVVSRNTAEWSSDIISMISNTLNYKEVKFEFQVESAGRDIMKVKLGGQEFASTLIEYGQGAGISVADQRSMAISYYNRVKTEPELMEATVMDIPQSRLHAPLMNKSGIRQGRQRTQSNTFHIGSKHLIHIACVDDGPNSFYVQLESREPMLNDMMHQINSKSHEPLTEELRPGISCVVRIATPGGSRVMCRATIMSFEGDMCRVFYTDYGNMALVASTSLYKLDTKFKSYKPMASRFMLSGVNKLSINREICNWFSGFISGKLLQMVVTEPEGPPVKQYCHLYLDDRSLLQIIKDKFFPVPKEIVNSAPKYPIIQLPTRSETIRVVVSYVDTSGTLPWSFYVQPEISLQDLENMMVEVGKFCKSKRAPEIVEAKEGDAIFAQFSGDSQWYRARVLKNNRKTALVSYVDYGNDEEVSAAATRCATIELVYKLPAQAILCRLQSADTLENGADVFTKITAMKGYNLRVIQQLPSGEYLVRMFDTSRFPLGDVGYDLILGAQVPSYNPHISPYQLMKPPALPMQVKTPILPVNADWLLTTQQSSNPTNTSGIAEVSMSRPSLKPPVQEVPSGVNLPIKEVNCDASPMRFLKMEASVEQWGEYDDKRGDLGTRDDQKNQDHDRKNIQTHNPRNDNRQSTGEGQKDSDQKPQDNRFGDRQERGRSLANQRDNNQGGQDNRFGDRQERGRSFANQRDNNQGGQNNRFGDRQERRRSLANKRDNNQGGGQNQGQDNKFGDRQERGRSFSNQRDNNQGGGQNQGQNNRFGDCQERGRSFSNQRDNNQCGGQNQGQDNKFGDRQERGRSLANQSDNNQGGGQDNRFGDRQERGRSLANQRDNNQCGGQDNKFGDCQERGRNFANQRDNNQGRGQNQGQNNRFGDRQERGRSLANQRDNNQCGGQDNKFGDCQEPGRNFANQRDNNQGGGQDNKFGDRQERGRSLANQRDNNQGGGQDNKFGDCQERGRSFANQRDNNQGGDQNNRFGDRQERSRSLANQRDNNQGGGQDNKFGDRQEQGRSFSNQRRYRRDEKIDKDSEAPGSCEDGQGRERRFASRESRSRDIPWNSGGVSQGTPWQQRSGDMSPRREARGDADMKRESGDLGGIYKSSRHPRGGFENKTMPSHSSEVTKEEEESWEDDPIPSKPKLRFTHLQMLPGATLGGFPVFTQSPWEFYVQPESTAQLLDTLMEKIDEVCKSGGSALSVKPSELAPLDACLAKYTLDDSWYRAQVVSVKDGKAKVKFVDYGNEDDVDVITAVKAVTSELLSLPAQAISCRLRGARPASGDNWSSDDIERFTAAVEDKQLQVELVALEGLRLLQFSVVLRVDGVCVNEQFGASSTSLLPRNSLAEQTLSSEDRQEASIAWFISPANFHLILNNRKKELSILQEELQHVECPPLQTVEQGSLVLAPLPAPQDGTFFRASVLAMKDTKVRVIDLDSGKIQVTQIIKLRAMPESLKETPAFSLPCQLHGVAALLGPEWPLNNEVINQVFQSHSSFLIKIVSRGEDGKLTVNLSTVDGTTCVADQLIKKGVATAVVTDTVTVVPNEQISDNMPPVTTPDIIEVSCKINQITDKLNQISDKLDSSKGVTLSPVIDQKEERPEERVMRPGQSYEVFVSYSEGLSFSVVMSAYNDALVGMQEDLQTAMASDERPTETRLGVLGVAKNSEDDIWYRAMALEPTTEKGTLVKFVDYGNEDITSDFKQLPEEFSSLPPFSVACRLPIKASSGDAFSEEAINKFESLVFDENLESITAQVFAKFGEIFIVELYIEDKSVTDILLSEKLTIPLMMQAYISHAESPSEFYIQLKDKENKLNEIEERLATEEFENLDKFEVGTKCIAKFTADDVWYRAKINSVTEKSTEVQFFDYGNSAFATEFRKLPDDLMSIPPMAKLCTLKNEPSNVKGATKFLDFAIDGNIEYQVLMPDVEESPLKVIFFRDGKDALENWIKKTCSHRKKSPGEPKSEIAAMEVMPDKVELFQKVMSVDAILKPEDIKELEVETGAEEAELPESKQSAENDEISTSKLIDIFISSYISPSNFFYQKVEDEEKLIEMQKHLSQLGPELVDQPEANVVYAVKLQSIEDHAWYRAHIIADDTDEHMVYLIDYGCIEKAVVFKNLPDNLKDIKRYSTPCYLKDAPKSEECCEKLKKVLFRCPGLQAGFSLGDEKTIDFIFKDGENVLKVICREPKADIKDVFMSNFISFNKFFVNLVSDVGKIQNLQLKLKETEMFESLDHVEVGMKCLARFSDNKNWYRAIVTSVTEKCTRVFFYDYGNSADTTELKKMTNEINMIPPMAKLCNLARIPTSEQTSAILSTLLQHTGDDIVIFQADMSEYKEGLSLNVTLMLEGKDVIDFIEESKEKREDNKKNHLKSIIEETECESDNESVAKNPLIDNQQQEEIELEMINETEDLLIDFQEGLEPKPEIKEITQDNQSEIEAAMAARCKILQESTSSRDNLYSSCKEIVETKAPPPTPEAENAPEEVEMNASEVINQLEEESSRDSESFDVTCTSSDEEHVHIVNKESDELVAEQMETLAEDDTSSDKEHVHVVNEESDELVAEQMETLAEDHTSSDKEHVHVVNEESDELVAEQMKTLAEDDTSSDKEHVHVVNEESDELVAEQMETLAEDDTSSDKEHVHVVNEESDELVAEQMETLAEDEMDICKPNSPQIKENNHQCLKECEEICLHAEKNEDSEITQDTEIKSVDSSDPIQVKEEDQKAAIQIETDKKEITTAAEKKSDEETNSSEKEFNSPEENLIPENLQITYPKIETIKKKTSPPNEEEATDKQDSDVMSDLLEYSLLVPLPVSDDSCEQEEMMMQLCADLCDLPEILGEADVDKPENKIKADPYMIPLPPSDSNDELEYHDILTKGITSFNALTDKTTTENSEEEGTTCDISMKMSTNQLLSSEIKHPEADLLEQAHLNILQQKGCHVLDDSYDSYVNAVDSICRSPQMSTPLSKYAESPFMYSPHKDANKTLTAEDILADLEEEGEIPEKLSIGKEKIPADFEWEGAKSLEYQSVSQIDEDLFPQVENEETEETRL